MLVAFELEDKRGTPWRCENSHLQSDASLVYHPTPLTGFDAEHLAEGVSRNKIAFELGGTTWDEGVDCATFEVPDNDLGLQEQELGADVDEEDFEQVQDQGSSSSSSFHPDLPFLTLDFPLPAPLSLLPDLPPWNVLAT